MTSTPDAQEPAHTSVDFTGWLGLLRALSDAFGTSGDAPPEAEP